MTWPVTQRFVFSQSTEQTVPSAKANSPLKAPVLLMVFSVGLFTEPFSCSSIVYSVRGFFGAGFFDELLRFFWGSSSDSTITSSSSSSSDSDLRGHPKSKQKPPTSIIPEDDARRWREGVSTQRDAGLGRALLLELGAVVRLAVVVLGRGRAARAARAGGHGSWACARDAQTLRETGRRLW